MIPTGKLPPQAWMHAAETRRVVDAFGTGRAEGAEIRFVGGCLRDSLAGRPVRDVDIATRLAPGVVTRRLEAAAIKVVPTGIAHGTVTAVVNGRPFEITTLRLDLETDGRRAKVAFTDDWTADAARRDFTFNALSCTPDGTLYDPFEGIADLKAGRVRFVGDPRARIEEDYLRLLRFFRFQAHYGTEPPDPAVLEITSALAPELRRLSGERVREELFKLLRARDPTPVVASMIEGGILQRLLPIAGDAGILAALLRAEGLEAPPRALESPDIPDPLPRLAALIEARPEAATRTAERLRLSNRQRDALVALADATVSAGPDLGPSDRRRLVHKLGAPLYRDLVRLVWARRHARDRQIPDETLRQALAEAEALAAKSFPLSGRDVLDFGLSEGPDLGRLLDQVETWWADQAYRPTRKACLEKLRALIAAG